MYYPSGEIKYRKPDPEKMCGDGRIELLEHAPQSPYLRAKYVRFVNGAHTKWHYHTGEQLLVGTKGTGFVEFRGLPDVTLCKGDRVFIPAGVWHRHGAAAGETLMKHLAVTTGETKWDKKDRCEKHRGTGDCDAFNEVQETEYNGDD